MYSKASLRPTRWVLVVPRDSAVRTPEDLRGGRVATELVGYTQRWFRERNIDVQIEFSWGATEAKVAEGLVDAIVEVTETGSTIKAHGLRIVCELFESVPQLIANRAAWNDPWKREKIEQIGLLLAGALRAEAQVGLKMNVPEGTLAGGDRPAAGDHRADRGQPLRHRVVRGRERDRRGDGAGPDPASCCERGPWGSSSIR